jgi:hypothetical protein
VRNTALKTKFNESYLLMLRMELKAIRDRAMADFDAALAKVDAALPAPDDSARQRDMRTWDRARWRQFRETGR